MNPMEFAHPKSSYETDLGLQVGVQNQIGKQRAGEENGNDYQENILDVPVGIRKGYRAWSSASRRISMSWLSLRHSRNCGTRV